MKNIILLIGIMMSNIIYSQVETEIYQRGLDFVINDLPNHLPKKSKIYFSGIIFSNGVSGFIRPSWVEPSVDTLGFDSANKSLEGVKKDSIGFIIYKNQSLQKRKKRKSYEIVVYQNLEYNSSAKFLKIVVSNNDRAYIYNLFIDENNIDCVFNTFID